MKFIDRLFKSDALSGCLLDYVQPANVQSLDSFKDEDFKDFLAKHLNVRKRHYTKLQRLKLNAFHFN